MPRSLIPHAEAKAAALGHDIRWDTIGETVANGHCSRCDVSLSLARSRDGLGESHGDALERTCRGTPPGSRRPQAHAARLP